MELVLTNWVRRGAGRLVKLYTKLALIGTKMPISKFLAIENPGIINLEERIYIY